MGVGGRRNQIPVRARIANPFRHERPEFAALRHPGRHYDRIVPRTGRLKFREYEVTQRRVVVRVLRKFAKLCGFEFSESELAQRQGASEMELCRPVNSRLAGRDRVCRVRGGKPIRERVELAASRPWT